MLPQNGLSRTPSQQQFNMPPFDPTYGAMDAGLQKQMMALNQANQARMNSNSSYGGGASSGSLFGGMQGTHDSYSAHNNFQIPPSTQSLSNSATIPSLDPSMSHSLPNSGHPPNVTERTRGFLQSIAFFMAKQNTPLPPALTGVQVPNYDPSTSMFNDIEFASEPGSFRLAGKDVDLFKLWGIVQTRGGSSAATNNNLWPSFLPAFDLPEQYPSADGSTMIAVAQTLQHIFTRLFSSFEEYYRRNQLEKQRMAAMKMNGGAQMPGTPTRPGQLPMQNPNIQNIQNPRGMGFPNMPGQPAQQGMNHTTNGGVVFPNNAPQPTATPQNVKGVPGADGIADSNGVGEQGIKRKLDSEELDGKRARQKTESLDSVFPAGSSERPIVGADNPASSSQITTMTQQTRPRLERSRRKIEYVPLAREVDTYGGRDLAQIEAELANQARRPLRELHEWGTIDIECLTMSIRSRLSTELSYALTTFTLLSTMKGQQPNTGFPISNCPDLLDEVLDLLEDLSFDGVEDHFSNDQDEEIVTNRTLVHAVYESETESFAALERHTACPDHNLGLRSKPGTVIAAILNIIRNLCIITDNGKYIAEHPRALDLLLRTCQLSPNSSLQPASAALSLGELITVRKDTLYTLCSIATAIDLSEESRLSSQLRVKLTKRIFQLIASYLVDPAEAVTPMGCVQGIGGITTQRPPSLADIALELFTKLGQTDANRQVLAKVIPQSSLWRLFVSLVHRLPVVDADFQILVMSKESWVSYFEKLIMALYALAFLSPPKLKAKMKTDRSLGYTGVMLRLVQKLLLQSNHEIRQLFFISTRRAIETMKLLDDGEDSFDTSKSTVTTLSFGVGYGEIGENEAERGTGLLGGHRDLGWDVLLLGAVNQDEQMFSELESLIRVEY